jgi:serine/threonine protein kinase/Flp pilus assembly protein TadD
MPDSTPFPRQEAETLWDRRKQVLQRFAEAWRAGRPPDLKEYLPTGDEERGQLLAALVQEDLGFRLKAGLPARVEEYLKDFPELESKPETLLELIVAEYHHCRAVGRTPTVADFLRRFPRQRAELLDRLGFSEAMTRDSRARPGTVLKDLPARLGRYRIEEEIARGGMGRVVRVHDEDFGRPLAMKVTLRTVQGRGDLEQRFLREARITGRLQHPGVPPVQELGRLPDGRPYFIMKLIQGHSLAELLRRRTRDNEHATPEPGEPAEPSRQPSSTTGQHSPADLPRFLAIFGQVCQTVAYAHARGIIHRDLKPANVMVGAFGEVQVMDWGLAKVLGAEEGGPTAGAEAAAAGTVSPLPGADPAEGTMAGNILGTPAYMAPEQARGEVDRLDRRCDVFGLGAILCEVLTGRPAFAGSVVEMVKRAQAGDLTEAFRRLERCGAEGELVRLAGKCLAPAPEDRPADAAALAEAVASYQADLQQRLKQAEIDQAAAQARWSAERKRRRTGRALAAVSLLFVLSAAAAGVWYFWDQAARAEERTRREAARAWRQAREDAQKEKLAREVGAALREEGQERARLQQRLTDSRQVHVLLSAIDRWHVLLDRREEILKRAARLVASNEDRIAAGLKGRVALHRARLEADRKDWDTARELDDIRLRAATLIEGKFNPARAAAEYAGVFARLGYPVEQGDPARVAARIGPSPLRLVLAAALDDWAGVLTIPGTKSAPKLLQNLLGVARRLDPDPWRDRVRSAVAARDAKELQALARQGTLREQPPPIILLLAFHLPGQTGFAALIQKALVHHPDDFWLNFDLGSRLTDPRERAGCFRAALAIRPTSSAAHNNLGNALHAQGDLTGAAREHRRAIALDPRDAQAHTNLGNDLQAGGDLAGAIEEHRRAIALDPRLAQAHNNLGVALRIRGDLAGAMQEFQRAIDLDPRNAQPHINLAKVLYSKKDRAGAIAAFRRAIALDPRSAQAHYHLGSVLHEAKDLTGAAAAFRQAIALDPRHAQARTNLGCVLFDSKDVAGAILEFRRALAIDPRLIQARANLGEALLAQGEFATAQQVLRYCLQMLSQRHPLRDPVQKLLQQCRQALQTEQRVNAVLQGQAQPTGAAEQLQLAGFCRQYGRSPAAARLYAAALAAQPALAEDLARGYRHQAACAAALAAAGQGKEAAQLGEKDRGKWRHQALLWLRADLELWRRQARDGQAALQALAGQLTAWQSDPDLAGVREPKALAELSGEERKAWQQFWADVAAQCKRVKGQNHSGKK